VIQLFGGAYSTHERLWIIAVNLFRGIEKLLKKGKKKASKLAKKKNL
jgi:hypothetical protein